MRAREILACSLRFEQRLCFVESRYRLTLALFCYVLSYGNLSHTVYFVLLWFDVFCYVLLCFLLVFRCYVLL